MGLIERLRNGMTEGSDLRWHVTPIHREAADALERLRGFAMHYDDCDSEGGYGPCTCGLDALIAELEGDDGR